MSVMEAASRYNVIDIQELSSIEIGFVAGGLSQFDIDWKRVAEVLRQYSVAAHNASEVGAAAAAVVATGALAQLGLDVPNDVLAAALAIAAGGTEATSWATGLLADYVGS